MDSYQLSAGKKFALKVISIILFLCVILVALDSAIVLILEWFLKLYIYLYSYPWFEWAWKDIEKQHEQDSKWSLLPIKIIMQHVKDVFLHFT